MSLEVGMELSECQQLFHREISSLCKNGIESRRRVALGEHEAVSLRIFGIFRIHVHFLKIEIGQDIRAGKRSAGMT
jgi:hypothetical protein